jgi:DNA polymerase-3 subunit delta
VIDCARYEFDGEDKARIERVEAFFPAFPQGRVSVRMPRAARFPGTEASERGGHPARLAELALLLEATGGDASRLAMEIEKLAAVSPEPAQDHADDIAALVPDAQSHHFRVGSLAVGRGDRPRALELLDTLSRRGEYMPLALTFLATQFRTALAAREAGVRGAGQIQAHFTSWARACGPERARQIEQTMEAFRKNVWSLLFRRCLRPIAIAGRTSRRPHFMEEMVFALTAR